MPRGWTYAQAAHRYRSAASGRFIAPSSVLEIRDDFLDRRQVRAALLSDDLVTGRLGVGPWEARMQRETRALVAAEYAYGKGGKAAMTLADWEIVGGAVRQQWAFLRRFAEQVQGGELTPNQIRARAQLYAGAGIGAHERGRAASWDVDLPAYPGDNRCVTNDRCAWELEPQDDGSVHAYWRGKLDDATCEDCRAHIAQWNPLVLPAA